MKTLFIKALLVMFMFFEYGIVKANSETMLDIQQILAELGNLPKNKLKMNHEELDSFAKRLQKISVDMSQNEVEELLGHPSLIFSHGEKAKDPDLYTFFSYELLLTEAPDSFYRITIIFSKRKKKILSIYSSTNLPLPKSEK